MEQNKKEDAITAIICFIFVFFFIFKAKLHRYGNIVIISIDILHMAFGV